MEKRTLDDVVEQSSEPAPVADDAACQVIRALFCPCCGGVIHPITGACLSCQAQVNPEQTPTEAMRMQAAQYRQFTPKSRARLLWGRVMVCLAAVVLSACVAANVWLGRAVVRLQVEEQVVKSYSQALNKAKKEERLGYKDWSFNAEHGIVVQKLQEGPTTLEVKSYDDFTVSLSDSSVAKVESKLLSRGCHRLIITPQRRGATLATIKDVNDKISILIVIT